eukprot:4621025-Pleurochrysis_carterae.AAC.1
MRSSSRVFARGRHLSNGIWNALRSYLTYLPTVTSCSPQAGGRRALRLGVGRAFARALERARHGSPRHRRLS